MVIPLKGFNILYKGPSKISNSYEINVSTDINIGITIHYSSYNYSIVSRIPIVAGACAFCIIMSLCWPVSSLIPPRPLRRVEDVAKNDCFCS